MNTKIAMYKGFNAEHGPIQKEIPIKFVFIHNRDSAKGCCEWSSVSIKISTSTQTTYHAKTTPWIIRITNPRIAISHLHSRKNNGTSVENQRVISNVETQRDPFSRLKIRQPSHCYHHFNFSRKANKWVCHQNRMPQRTTCSNIHLEQQQYPICILNTNSSSTQIYQVIMALRTKQETFRRGEIRKMFLIHDRNSVKKWSSVTIGTNGTR